mmetsp:Transcript_34488/g.46193  ORF Transcript_34488/g.46193 Transcript_34488/m.46193 type:complete len:154 (+) Transcript_34488:549-1010(+)
MPLCGSGSGVGSGVGSGYFGVFVSASFCLSNAASTSMTSSSSADPINVRDESGCAPLLIASQDGHADLAAFSIKRYADVKAVDNSHDSALHWAAYKGSVPVCGLLLNLNGIQNHLDQAGAFGQTPLHLASLRGNTEVVLYLMEEAEAWSGKAA